MTQPHMTLRMKFDVLYGDIFSAKWDDPMEDHEEDRPEAMKIVKFVSWCKTVLENSAHKVTEEEQEQCVVCLEDYQVGKVVAKLYCGHLHHRSCIEKWMDQEDNNSGCPACRTDMFTYNF